MNRLPHLVAAFYGAIWAILPSKLAEIQALLELKAAGHDVDPETITQIVGVARRTVQPSIDAIGVLPLAGTIYPRANMVAEASGGTSVERWVQDFRGLLAEPSVKGILIDIESPGGAVNGIEEAATEINRARSIKPVYAVANHLAASAAYWLGSQAERLYVSPSGEVGSIGVFAQHDDVSKALEQEGIKSTLVSAGKYKTDGSPYEPLTDTARAHLQARVDDYYTAFVKAVARGRGVSADVVRGGYGEGRVVGARQAVREGMADAVGTFDDALGDLGKRVRQGASTGQAAAGYIGVGGSFTVTDDVAVDSDPPADVEQPAPPVTGLSDDARRRRLRLVAGAP